MKTILKFVAICLVLLSAISAYAEVKEGYGKATLPDSSVYEGEFKNGLFNGKGTLTWRDGGKYEGEFKDGLMNGEGAITLREGSIYKGGYKDGLPDGKGVSIR